MDLKYSNDSNDGSNRFADCEDEQSGKSVIRPMNFII